MRDQKTLKETSESRMDTCMIYSIFAFEQEFGELWGHGLKLHELTDEQAEMRRKWQNCRTLILDNGNKQKRSLINFITKLNVEPKENRLNLNFTPRGYRND